MLNRAFLTAALLPILPLSCAPPESSPGPRAMKEIAFPDDPGVIRRATFDTPWGERELTYRAVRGLAVIDGDMILGPDPLGDFGTSSGGLRSSGAVRTSASAKWSNFTVSFNIDPSLDDPGRVNEAVARWEARTPFNFINCGNPCSASSFISFIPSPDGSCSSNVGRVGGQQNINVADWCDEGSLMHEIGHAMGLWHEQSRSDRDANVDIRWENIPEADEFNFQTYVERGSDGQDVGAYNIQSAMHYDSFAFSQDGDPTITRLDGSTFDSQRDSLHATDICAIEKFYGYGGRKSDFNGDGFDDLVIGVPFENLGGSDEGVVQVIFGTASGLGTTDQLIHRDQPSVEDTAISGDRFGWSHAIGDFNGDGLADLAVGVPFDDVSGVTDVGSVQVFYGTILGVNTVGDEIWHQATAGVPGDPETDDQFGRALAAGDFDKDGYADLAVGSPMEGVGSESNAGAVTILYGSSGGLTTTGAQLFTQGTSGVPGSAEATDRFGASLAVGDFDDDDFDDLAIGVPGEAVGSDSDAGAVNVLYGATGGLSTTGAELWDESDSGMPTNATADDAFGAAVAAGDFNMDGFDDLAIGVPGENSTFNGNVGSVTILFGLSSGLDTAGSTRRSQGVVGVTDSAETDDRFGSVLAAADVNGDGWVDLIVGIPNEDIGSLDNAGAIHVLFGSNNGPSTAGDILISQDTANISGAAEAGDEFGSSIVVGDWNGDCYPDLAIGVEFEHVGSIADSGAIQVMHGALEFDGTDDVIITQDSTDIQETAETSDRMGHER